MTRKILLAALLSLASLAALADNASQAPDQVVKDTVKTMFDTVNHDKAELQKDPQKLYGVVSKTLLPHFDMALAAQLVLAQHWRTATPKQREDFQQAFYSYLVRSYADALVKGNYSERNVQVEPYRAGSDPNRAFVKTKVLPENGQPVEVDFAMRNESGTWKAFDVVIEGISYVHNYHDQFGPEIDKSGLDELIHRLSTSKAPNAVPASATKH